MAYEIINIPLSPGSRTFSAEDLNKFCSNKKIIRQRIKFFQQDGSAFWSVFLEYEPLLEGARRETAGLTEAGIVCFDELRRWRRETAEREGIPPYVIAKNSNLVEIIQREITTLEALKQIHGFGAKKIEKYGKDIIGIVESFYKEARRPGE